MYVLIKIIKFCTGSSAKSYQCKFAISNVLANSDVTSGELGSVIRKVIHYRTLRGKFSSVHPELRSKGINRIEVGEGLHFIRETGSSRPLIRNAKKLLRVEDYITRNLQVIVQVVLSQGKCQTFKLAVVRTKRKRRSF